jgi:L-seryl-tRNA(Ser) seleniumtransferase
LQRPSVQSLIQTFSRQLVLLEIQDYLQKLREAVSSGEIASAVLDNRLATLEEAVSRSLERLLSQSPRRVINATGVLLHTNLGRAPLAEQAFDSVRAPTCSYSDLEYDLTEGRRSHRDRHFQTRLVRLLKCEAATVVNNNAAALFLILNTLARGYKVLVSRGELIEIGGSFRIPAIMEQSGAVLKEVGTTNKTTVEDYREALDDEVRLILSVHTSNYKIVGFTERPELAGLAALAREHEIPLVKDSGSGLLFNIPHPALQNEPSAQFALSAGADLVCFSGDKLLGGPQAGIIVGRKTLVDKVRSNPLMRICRVDKMTYGILDWTLLQYEKGEHPRALPVWLMFLASEQEIRLRAEALAPRLAAAGFQTEVVPGLSVAGGGAAPEESFPTSLLRVRSERHSATEMQRSLRQAGTPVVVRVEEDAVVLDLRTVLPEEEPSICAAFSSLPAA